MDKSEFGKALSARNTDMEKSEIAKALSATRRTDIKTHCNCYNKQITGTTKSRWEFYNQQRPHRPWAT